MGKLQTGYTLWQSFFADYQDDYILLDGAMKTSDGADVDNPWLYVEILALSDRFCRALSDFIFKSSYKEIQTSRSHHEHYYFIEPEDCNFPMQIGLFLSPEIKFNLPKTVKQNSIELPLPVECLSVLLEEKRNIDIQRFIVHSTIKVYGYAVYPSIFAWTQVCFLCFTRWETVNP